MASSLDCNVILDKFCISCVHSLLVSYHRWVQVRVDVYSLSKDNCVNLFKHLLPLYISPALHILS